MKGQGYIPAIVPHTSCYDYDYSHLESYQLLSTYYRSGPGKTILYKLTYLSVSSTV